MHKLASWVNVRKFFPRVKKPLFHATQGGRATQIALNHQGLKSQSGVSNHGEGNTEAGGISMSRNLDFLLRGNFGNVIFVFDETELSRRYRVAPVAYGHSSGWEDEFEERVFAKTIPDSLIRGVIFRNKLRRFEYEEWTSAVRYPVVWKGDHMWEVAPTTSPMVSNRRGHINMLISNNTDGSYEPVVARVVARHIQSTQTPRFQKLTSAKVSADIKTLGPAGKYHPQLRNIVVGTNCKQITPVMVSVSLETRSRGVSSEQIQDKWRTVLDTLLDAGYTLVANYMGGDSRIVGGTDAYQQALRTQIVAVVKLTV